MVCPAIWTPIWRRGIVTRSIGRFDKLSSPTIVAAKSCPASTPEIKRMEVPEFPMFSVFVGALRPAKPTPWIVTTSPSSSIWTPKSRKTCMVDRTSSPRKISWIVVTPLAKLPNIIERWLIDLSPGTWMHPANPFAFVRNCIENLIPDPFYILYHKKRRETKVSGRWLHFFRFYLPSTS